MKKNILPAVIILVGIGLLYLLNSKMNPPSPQDTSTTADQKKPDSSAKNTVAADDPIPPELVAGNPQTAKIKLEVGWVYDSTNQAHPQALKDAISALETGAANSNGAVSAQIVDLDMPASDLSPLDAGVTNVGITIIGPATAQAAAGTMDLSGDLGEGDLTANRITDLISRLH